MKLLRALSAPHRNTCEIITLKSAIEDMLEESMLLRLSLVEAEMNASICRR